MGICLGGCLLSATEVVGPQDAVLVPGLDGEYYTPADLRTTGSVSIAGRPFEASSVQVRSDPTTRDYPSISAKGPIRLMPINDRFYLMQMPTVGPSESRPVWLLALVRFDTRAGFIDLHCATKDLKPAPATAQAHGQGQPDFLAAFVDGRGRSDTIDAIRLQAAGSPPLLRRLIRKEVAEQGLPNDQAPATNIAACADAWINVAGGLVGTAAGSFGFLDFLRGMFGGRQSPSVPPPQGSPQSDDAARSLLQQLLKPKSQ